MSQSDAANKIEARRDGLEELVECDGPTAWIAEALLEAADGEAE